MTRRAHTINRAHAYGRRRHEIEEVHTVATIPMGKSRKASDPYMTFVARTAGGDWTTKVLKAYSLDPDERYARWFCDVATPYTGGGSDMGDTYTQDIIGQLWQLDPSVPLDAIPQRYHVQAVALRATSAAGRMDSPGGFPEDDEERAGMRQLRDLYNS